MSPGDTSFFFFNIGADFVAAPLASPFRSAFNSHHLLNVTTRWSRIKDQEEGNSAAVYS